MPDDIRLLIADDHPLFRQGLRQVIEKDTHLTVVAEADNGNAALRMISEFAPQIALLDLELPEKDGFDVVRGLHNKGLPTKVIFLTMHKDEMHFNEAMNLHVDGYVVKDSTAIDIIDCIRTVAAGRRYISPALSYHLLNRSLNTSSFFRRQPVLSELTPTEQRILALLAEYMTSREIAGELGVSVRTVENHRANIAAKLNLSGRFALVKFALQHKSELF